MSPLVTSLLMLLLNLYLDLAYFPYVTRFALFLTCIRVYLGFLFIGFMLLEYIYIYIYIYIYLNSLNNKINLFYDIGL